MNAPRRWLEEGGTATSQERDLLRSALDVEPPPDAQRQVWAAVALQIAPTGVGHDGGGSGAAGGKAAAAGKAALAGKAVTTVAAKGAAGKVALAGAAGAGLLKSAFIGAGAAVAVIATYTVVTPPAAPERPVDPVAAVATPSTAAPRPATPVKAATPAPAEPATPEPAAPAATPGAEPTPWKAPASASASASAGAPSTPPAPVEVERESMLREESRLVGEARDALRGGDVSGALSRLDQIRTRFPGGILTQEREALTIEALARSGRRGEASARAAAFLQAYPTSVLAERVQAFAH